MALEERNGLETPRLARAGRLAGCNWDKEGKEIGWEEKVRRCVVALGNVLPRQLLEEQDD